MHPVTLFPFHKETIRIKLLIGCRRSNRYPCSNAGKFSSAREKLQGARTTGANVSTRSSPNNVSVFATGLNNPRGLKFGPDGNHYGEMYHQHLEGHLDPRVWHEVETPMRDLINARPGIRAWWRLYSNWFGEEFVNYVNQVQQTATPPRMFREPMKDE
jgi:hypothetical protein